MSFGRSKDADISRRQMLTLLGAGALGTALAACGTPTASSGPYKGKFVIFSVAVQAQSEPLIKAIEKAHPGVQVVWRTLTSENFTTLFSAAVLAHDQIDLMDLNGQDLRRYAVGHELLDLSSISYKSRFVPDATQVYTVDNKLWALPRGGIGGFTFFYNKKLLQQIGYTKELQTYSDLQEIAPELKKIGVAPFVHPGKDIYLWPVWMFWALAQTTKNQAVETTFKTLSGKGKFTDPEYVAALELIHKYAQDGMFIQGVNGLDTDGATVNFTQGKALFYYTHTGMISTVSTGNYPKLDMDVIPPLLAVSDTTVKRQMPGGYGDALGVYAKIDSSRKQLAMDIANLMTSDTWVKWANQQGADPASCNKNVQASNNPLAIKYAQTCAPNQITYLDWYWPPEITTAFQQNIQTMISGSGNPTSAAQAVQRTMDQVRQDGYTFQS
ncbi:solute-binding protein [Dictyobacter sp. S3.2.2.5]|uniref:Solute-binding protein n=1 Tax=Dictyobacter halimunensis TaxID=3026934 RepID=A0ABQ6FN85_9CHLR|nr:solute-binding protein [Dictyobacter sp. S3.2.2.5]